MGVYEAIARRLNNAALVHAAALQVGVPLPLLCAVVEKETLGEHVYGNDTGGVFSTPGEPDILVTRANFLEYERRVLAGETPNGVGIMQITYAGTKLANGTREGGFLRQAWKQGLDLSDPYDNLCFGAGLLKSYVGSSALSEVVVKTVGTRWYNGRSSYGAALWTVYQRWDAELRAATDPLVTDSDLAALRELVSRFEAIRSNS